VIRGGFCRTTARLLWQIRTTCALSSETPEIDSFRSEMDKSDEASGGDRGTGLPRLPPESSRVPAMLTVVDDGHGQPFPGRALSGPTPENGHRRRTPFICRSFSMISIFFVDNLGLFVGFLSSLETTVTMVPRAFQNYSGVASVSFASAGPTQLGESAFARAAAVASLTFATATKIDIRKWAFVSIGALASLAFPVGVTMEIGTAAFNSCRGLTAP